MEPFLFFDICDKPYKNKSLIFYKGSVQLQSWKIVSKAHKMCKTDTQQKSRNNKAKRKWNALTCSVTLSSLYSVLCKSDLREVNFWLQHVSHNLFLIHLPCDRSGHFVTPHYACSHMAIQKKVLMSLTKQKHTHTSISIERQKQKKQKKHTKQNKPSYMHQCENFFELYFVLISSKGVWYKVELNFAAFQEISLLQSHSQLKHTQIHTRKCTQKQTHEDTIDQNYIQNTKKQAHTVSMSLRE